MMHRVVLAIKYLFIISISDTYPSGTRVSSPPPSLIFRPISLSQSCSIYLPTDLFIVPLEEKTASALPADCAEIVAYPSHRAMLTTESLSEI
jgi:hypothetical protein